MRPPSRIGLAGAVAARVLRQLARDRRFLVLSLAAPVAVIYLLRVFFDAFQQPFVDTTQYVVPVSAFIVHFITYVLCAVVLVRERTAETLQRMFVNGYRQREIVGGYVVAYSALATLQCLLVLGEVKLLFGLTLPARVLAMTFVVIWLLAVTSIAIGILVSNFARNEGQVFPFIPMVILPSVFLSGILLPVSGLPPWARVLARVVPLYYANDVLRHVLANAAFAETWPGFARLAAYGAAVLIVATISLRETT